MSRVHVPEEVKQPIIQPPYHRLSELIFVRSHLQGMHGGVRDTLTQLRERYWIHRARSLGKRVIHGCYLCKRFRTRPGSAPAAPLPGLSLSSTNPFEAVGIDFAGLLYIRSYNNPKGYIALFTCATSRVVHLELVNLMTSEAFLMCFRRVESLRGLPRVIYSDNAKAFRKISSDVKRLH